MSKGGNSIPKGTIGQINPMAKFTTSTKPPPPPPNPDSEKMRPDNRKPARPK